MAVLDKVFKILKWEEAGIKINGEYLNSLRFANDDVLMSKSAQRKYNCRS